MSDNETGTGVFGPPDVTDEDRDEAYVSQHSLCADCDGLICLRGPMCPCGNDLGKVNPEEFTTHIHDDAEKCPGLVQFPPAARGFVVPSAPAGQALVEEIMSVWRNARGKVLTDEVLLERSRNCAAALMGEYELVRR